MLKYWYLCIYQNKEELKTKQSGYFLCNVMSNNTFQEEEEEEKQIIAFSGDLLPKTT